LNRFSFRKNPIFKRLHKGPQMLDKVHRMNITARCARQLLTSEKRAFGIRRAAGDEKRAREMAIFVRTRKIGPPHLLWLDSVTAGAC
jgi:hypothetical protein